MPTLNNSFKDTGVTLVEALKRLYVKLGGSLTDTYEDINDGGAVSEYVLVPDCVSAITEVAEPGGGGGEFSDLEKIPITFDLTFPEGFSPNVVFLITAFQYGEAEFSSEPIFYSALPGLCIEDDACEIVGSKTGYTIIDHIEAYGIKDDSEVMCALTGSNMVLSGDLEYNSEAGAVIVTGPGAISGTLTE